MSPGHIFASLLLGIACLFPLTATAENSKDFGDYVVHFNALSTEMLPPKVAREYHITRSRNVGMINVTILKKVLGSPGQPVHARVEVRAENLAGQARNIRLAVVVATEAAAKAIREIGALALPESAAAMKIFTDMDEAEAWLARPLDQMP